jgi:MFS family permease
MGHHRLWCRIQWGEYSVTSSGGIELSPGLQLGGAAGAFLPIGFPSLQHDLNSTRLQDSAALGLFALGYGTIPLVTSAFSEEVGRRPLYIISVICFTLLSMGIGL